MSREDIPGYDGTETTIHIIWETNVNDLSIRGIGLEQNRSYSLWTGRCPNAQDSLW